MSTNNNAAPRTSTSVIGAEVPLIVRRIVSNLQLWISTLIRKPRVKAPPIGIGAFIVFAGAIAVIIASMFLLDAPASEWARQLPLSLSDAADQISNFGLSSRFLYPLAFFLLLLAALTKRSLPLGTRGVLGIFAARAGFLFLAIGVPSLFDTVVKRLIGRARPYVGPHDDPFAYLPFIWRADHASMPSGHATTVAAAAIAVGAIWPRARPFAWLYALIVMSARVVLNVHHPSDVIAGALVGIVGALMVRRWFAVRRLVFFAHDLTALPGPSWARIKAVARRIIVDAPTRAA